MPRTKALLIGINYVGTEHELRGCANDIKRLFEFFTRTAALRPENTRVLSDAIRGAAAPTKENMVRGLQWLVQDCQENDTLILCFSGHGMQVQDVSGDERDKYDEVMVPADYEEKGVVSDDDMQTYLKQLQGTGAVLVGLFDCCHSGTVLDLPHEIAYAGKRIPASTPQPGPLFADNEWPSEFHVVTSTAKAPTAPDVILFSSCLDSQTSADAYISRKFQGASTFCLMDTLSARAGNGTLGKDITSWNWLSILKEVNAKLSLHNFNDQHAMLSVSNAALLSKVFSNL